MTKKLVLGFSTIIFLLQLLFISYINYIDFIDLQITISNSLISDKSVSFIFRKNKTPSLYEFSELLEPYSDITLLSELHNFNNLRVWGIYGDCHLDNNANSLINGAFFMKEDFLKGNFKAVIGENILNSDNCFLDENGKTYFKFNNNNYEVVGTIDTNITKMLDNTAFLNLDSFNIECLSKFVIDGIDSNVINNTVNRIKQKYNIDIIKEDDNFIERYMFDDIDKHTLNVFIIVFISILIITLLMFTLRYYKEEIMVKRIIGISFKKILFDLFKNIFVLALMNTAFFVSGYIIIYYNILQKIHLSFYCVHLIIFSCTIFLIMFLFIYLYMIISNNFFYRNGVK